MTHLTPIPGWVLYTSLAILSAGLLLALVRLARGPSIPDRVVAFDLMTALTVGLIGVVSILVDQPAYLDAAIVLALISFLATIAFAYYLEKGTLPWRRRAKRQEEG